jgi:hypothetical protein
MVVSEGDHSDGEDEKQKQTGTSTPENDRGPVMKTKKAMKITGPSQGRNDGN